MPTPLVVNDYLKFTVACRVSSKSQNGLNDIIYRVVNTGGANLEAVPLAMYNRVVTQYAAWLPSIASFAGVSVSRLNPGRRAGPFYQVFLQAGLAGTDMLPGQASALIRKTSPPSLEGVPQLTPGKGRIYVPFPALTSYNGSAGVFSSLGMSRLESIRAVLGPAIILTGGISLQMILRRTSINPPPAPPTFLGYTDVSQLLSLRAVATQRRRGDFGRLNAAFGGIL